MILSKKVYWSVHVSIQPNVDQTEFVCTKELYSKINQRTHICCAPLALPFDCIRCALKSVKYELIYVFLRKFDSFHTFLMFLQFGNLYFVTIRSELIKSTFKSISLAFKCFYFHYVNLGEVLFHKICIVVIFHSVRKSNENILFWFLF